MTDSLSHSDLVALARLAVRVTGVPAATWVEAFAALKHVPEGASINVLGLSVRATYALHGNANIQTIRQLIERSEADLLRIPNFGRKSLIEVRAALKSIGLALKEKP